MNMCCISRSSILSSFSVITTLHSLGFAASAELPIMGKSGLLSDRTLLCLAGVQDCFSMNLLSMVLTR
jgi:hypothetical protein